MEHRLNERVPARLKLEIFRNGKCLGKFSVKNISAGGVAIYDTHERLNLYDFLEILVPPVTGDELLPSRLQAMVVHTRGEIAGAMIAPRGKQSLHNAA